jgi:hypothetical protein
MTCDMSTAGPAQWGDVSVDHEVAALLSEQRNGGGPVSIEDWPFAAGMRRQMLPTATAQARGDHRGGAPGDQP